MKAYGGVYIKQIVFYTRYLTRCRRGLASRNNNDISLCDTAKNVRNMKILTLWLTPQAGGQPLSAVRYCLFNIFEATLGIWMSSPQPATRRFYMQRW
jgi:hypothetical protein